ncbi:hypothetical protein HPB50_007016 [Hyalomma asiaticum]|uniref:Uncharacterized protein n=1 Tax=Hyalomma asiaticum TaxID=266040 RepID=A0ACB7TJP6_HYAAI|nr:hypothetical protein HPB50_007016 [Hyalomma asiaticum]
MSKSASGGSPRRHKKSTSALRMVSRTRTDETYVCQLFGCISKYERLLRHLGVRLREMDDADVGNLQSVSIREIRFSASIKRRHTDALFIAGHVLEFLPNVHKCVADLELNRVIANDVSLLKAVMNSPSLRRVRMPGEMIFQEKMLESMCNTERSLSKIEDLELWAPSASRLHHILISVRELRCPVAILASVDAAQLWAALPIAVQDIEHASLLKIVVAKSMLMEAEGRHLAELRSCRSSGALGDGSSGSLSGVQKLFEIVYGELEYGLVARTARSEPAIHSTDADKWRQCCYFN